MKSEAARAKESSKTDANFPWVSAAARVNAAEAARPKAPIEHRPHLSPHFFTR